VIAHLYGLGIHPDWWKLEAQPSAAAWRAIGRTIENTDPLCRGVLLLGLDAPEAELAATMRLAAAEPSVRGFAIGRTIFGDAARRWLAGEIADEAAIADMADRFARLAAAWQAAGGSK
jgi:5-dehydro-2-deoxygluconokinase